MFGRICEEHREKFKEGGSCLILDLDSSRSGELIVAWWGQVMDLGDGKRITAVIFGGRFDWDPNSGRYVMTEERDNEPLAENHYILPDTRAFRELLRDPVSFAAYMDIALVTAVGYAGPASEPRGIAFMT